VSHDGPGTEAYNLARFLAGDHLESILDHSLRYMDVEATEVYSKPLLESCHRLMGTSSADNPLLNGIYLDDSRTHQHDSAQNLKAYEDLWTLFFRAFVAVYMADYDSAETLLCQLKRFKRISPIPHVIENQFLFYQGIVAAILASRERTGRKRRRKLDLAQRAVRKLRSERPKQDPTLWNKIFLLEAHIQAVHGQHEGALLLFHKSMEMAERDGLSHEQGLAYELAGIMCQSCGRTMEADLYLTQAQALYRQWGAIAKVKRLSRTSSSSQSQCTRTSRSQSTRTSTSSQSRTSRSCGSLTSSTSVCALVK
jgi:hypothetical protein